MMPGAASECGPHSRAVVKISSPATAAPSPSIRSEMTMVLSIINLSNRVKQRGDYGTECSRGVAFFADDGELNGHHPEPSGACLHQAQRREISRVQHASHAELCAVVMLDGRTEIKAKKCLNKVREH